MIRDPLKEIKKTSKLHQVSLDGMSGEKSLKKSRIEALDTEISDNNNQSEVECVIPKKKHKKAKRKQEALEDGSKPPKKIKNIQDSPSTETELPVAVDCGKESLKVVAKSKEQKEKQSVPGRSGGDKDSLMGRLGSESAYIKGVLSLLHIPKHKQSSNAESDDDGVSDITPEIRRQMRIKLQAQMKSHPRAHNLTQLQERLRLKLAELRGDDSNAQAGKGKKKKKLTKAEKKQKGKAEKKLKAKLARGEQKFNGQKLNVPVGTKPAKPVYNNDGKMVFSKFDFKHGESAINGDNKKSTLDPKAALGKIQKQKEKIHSLQAIGKTERVKNIEEKSAWKSAMDKAEGVKVKDDESLLKKTIKRMDKKKKSSKKKWESRVEGEEKRKTAKQHKRTDNIKKRKHDKKENKFKKAAKKGRSVPGFR